MTDEQLKAQVDAYVDEVWEDAVEDIRSLVKIRSVEDLSQAQPGMPWGPACHDALVEGLRIAERLGLEAHECEGYLGYADLPGESEVQIATIAHSDVVPEGLGWSVEPYEVTRREGYLMGRGVLDDKGPLVLSLYAAHFFVREVQRTGKKLPYTLRCLVGNDEETTMGDLVWYLEHYPMPAFAFTPDADFPLICGEKGVYHGNVLSAPLVGAAGSVIEELDGGTVPNAVPGRATAVVRRSAASLAAAEHIELEELDGERTRVVAHGRGGHASMPAHTLNAIGVLADYLLAQDACSQDERTFLEFLHVACAASTDGSSLGIAASNDRFGPLTCIGGTVRTVGDHYVQTLDSRYPDATTADAITETLSQLAASYGCSYEVDHVKVPFYTDPQSPEIQALLSTYREYSGDMTEPMVIGGGTYARNFAKACAFGPNSHQHPKPSWIGPEHGADEGVSEEVLREALKIYIVAIARLMALDLS